METQLFHLTAITILLSRQESFVIFIFLVPLTAKSHCCLSVTHGGSNLAWLTVWHTVSHTVQALTPIYWGPQAWLLRSPRRISLKLSVPWESVCLGPAVVNQLNVRLCDYAQSKYLWWPIDHHLCDSLLLSVLSLSQSVCLQITETDWLTTGCLELGML